MLILIPTIIFFTFMSSLLGTFVALLLFYEIDNRDIDDELDIY